MEKNQNMKKIDKCPLCYSNNVEAGVFLHDKAFICSASLEKQPLTQVDVTTVSLAYCEQCGAVFNECFDREKMNKAYKSKSYVVKKILKGQMSNNLTYISGKIVSYISSNMTVMEIGCGDGRLAMEIAGHCKEVITVDPSYASISTDIKIKNIKHYHDYFNEDIMRESGKVDMVIARHLFEHLTGPVDFLNLIKQALTENGVLYLELPNMQEIVSSARYYDIFNDHFGYYSKETLLDFLERFGFSELESISMFCGQHIGLFLQNGSPMEVTNRKAINYNFSALYDQIDKVNDFIADCKGIIGVYGAGAHGVTIYDYMTKKARDNILCYFDGDKSKEGLYIPGTDKKVLARSCENINKCNVIILAISLYEEEVSQKLRGNRFEGTIVKTAKRFERDFVCV